MSQITTSSSAAVPAAMSLSLNPEPASTAGLKRQRAAPCALNVYTAPIQITLLTLSFCTAQEARILNHVAKIFKDLTKPALEIGLKGRTILDIETPRKRADLELCANLLKVDFVALLNQMTNIQEIYLWDLEESWVALCARAKPFLKCTLLDVSNARPSEITLAALMELCPNLTSLEIGNCNSQFKG